MRICFLASRDWTHPEAAGGDYYLGNLARSLAERGHRILFLSSAFENKKGLEQLDKVEILRLKPGLLYPLRLLLAFLRVRASTDVLVEEMFGGKKLPTFGLFYRSKHFVAIWYQRHERILAEQYPRPVAAVLSIMERAIAQLYRKTRIVTLSGKSLAELVELGLDSSLIEIVPSAALMEFPRPDELPSLKERHDALVFIGKIRKYKRIDHAILALSRLSLTRDNYRLVIAGNLERNDARCLAELKNLARGLNLADRVDFRIYPGAIPQREKVELLKRSKILLQTSPVEGFSMTSVEANACGTPVVASDGVPRDTIEPGQNGFVYPFGDIDAMSKCCENLLDQDRVWEDVSATGLKMAQKFSWKTTTDAFEHAVLKNLNDGTETRSLAGSGHTTSH